MAIRYKVINQIMLLKVEKNDDWAVVGAKVEYSDKVDSCGMKHKEYKPSEEDLSQLTS